MDEPAASHTAALQTCRNNTVSELSACAQALDEEISPSCGVRAKFLVQTAWLGHCYLSLKDAERDHRPVCWR